MVPPLALLQQQFSRMTAQQSGIRSGKPILNSLGLDIRSALERAAGAAQVPLELVLACAMAESTLNPQAERWGTQTAAARTAIATGDRAGLHSIVANAWADISFGYGQRIVLYHYVGDRSQSVANVLAVRQYVFDHPDEDLVQLGVYLAPAVARARTADLSPCDGDELLGALIIYNSGSMHPPGDPWWVTWHSNVQNYRQALTRARQMVTSG